MTIDTLESNAGLDRLATSDEIRAAISFLPCYLMECAKATLGEVPSDLGGYVNVNPEEVESIILIEKLDDSIN